MPHVAPLDLQNHQPWQHMGEALKGMMGETLQSHSCRLPVVSKEGEVLQCGREKRFPEHSFLAQS